VRRPALNRNNKIATSVNYAQVVWGADRSAAKGIGIECRKTNLGRSARADTPTPLHSSSRIVRI
jgi:hypothetical protein